MGVGEPTGSPKEGTHGEQHDGSLPSPTTSLDSESDHKDDDNRNVQHSLSGSPAAGTALGVSWGQPCL